LKEINLSIFTDKFIIFNILLEFQLYNNVKHQISEAAQVT